MGIGKQEDGYGAAKSGSQFHEPRRLEPRRLASDGRDTGHDARVAPGDERVLGVERVQSLW